MKEAELISNTIGKVSRIGGKTLTFWGGVISELGSVSEEVSGRFGNEVSAKQGPNFSLITVNVAPTVAPSLVQVESGDNGANQELVVQGLPELLVARALDAPNKLLELSSKVVNLVVSSE